MASNRVTKAKAIKKDVAKSPTKPNKLAREAGRELLEERLEFVLTCIKETGIKVDMTAVARHYGISTNAAQLRLRRVNDYVAKMVSAREAAQKSDEVPKDDEDLDVTTEDEDA
ncbi:hypothetical protein N7516_011092 [Penicillium verrucosum]|uniref:uncharacterized protein n=1 Tax=Penicillium verrucosum TaxID=60171 RepID=UPI0025454D9F|nr:uncharacterized protein N7516_011092 [Penicillium verrucosum]KAJ5920234.1 hypothetical protein N7516_011092 [Penicillium verrucosum]